MTENFIDELSIIITPILSADDASINIFNAIERLAPEIISTFTLKNIEKMDGDCIWLQYRKQGEIE